MRPHGVFLRKHSKLNLLYFHDPPDLLADFPCFETNRKDPIVRVASPVSKLMLKAMMSVGMAVTKVGGREIV